MEKINLPTENSFDSLEGIEPVKSEVKRDDSEAEQNRIKSISDGIKVNERTSGVGIESTLHITESKFPVFAESIKKTNVHKLIELCCGNRREGIGRDSDPYDDLRLLNFGIDEYVGVDKAFDEDFQGVREDKKSGNKLKWSYSHEEALSFLSKQPDNSSHLMMCGIESETTSGKVSEWAKELFNQMKRVVPNEGVIYLQGFIFNEGVIDRSSLKEVFGLRGRLPTKLPIKGRREDGSTYNPSDFSLVLVGEEEGYGNKMYKFSDDKLGVDWYFIGMKGQDANYRYSENPPVEEAVSTAECHGAPFFLVNKK